MTSRRSADENGRYLRWLEEMWEVHKADLSYRNTEREEKRKEEILEMLSSLGELAKRRLDPPESPPW